MTSGSVADGFRESARRRAEHGPTAAAGGDAARRLDALVAQHFGLVWRMLRRLGATPADADDAAQEVFLVAARRLDAIELGRERPFLIGVAVRVFATQRRSVQRRHEEPEAKAHQLASSAADPSEHIELTQARELLNEALAGLPLEQRTVLVLYELEELSVVEIAELLQAPRGTISWRLKVAREAFSAAAKRLRAQSEHPRRST